MRNLVLSFLAGVVFCWFILNPLVEKVTNSGTIVSYKDIITTKVSVKRDTIFIPRLQEKTIVLTVPVASVYDTTMLDTIRIDSYAKKRYAANFTRKIYEDSTQVEKDLSIGYRADVTGILNSMQLSYRDKRPQQVIVDSVNTSTTILRVAPPKRALYLGAEASLRSAGPTLQYQDRKGNAFKVGVNALSIPTQRVPEISVGYSKKLF